MISPILSKAISYGITAPNPHNTQAWKVKILNPTSFLLYVDEKRLVTASDPPTRQIHVGQGTFIETVTVGIPVKDTTPSLIISRRGNMGVMSVGRNP